MEKKGTPLMGGTNWGNFLVKELLRKFTTCNLKFGQNVAMKVINKAKVMKVGLIDQIKWCFLSQSRYRQPEKEIQGRNEWRKGRLLLDPPCPTDQSRTEPMAEEFTGSGCVPNGEERWSDDGAVVTENGGARCRCWRVWKSPFGGDKSVGNWTAASLSQATGN
ncbi:CBL-interacting serine/threonine-protein kinase 20 [Sarracenia purpurea var. burkii]